MTHQQPEQPPATKTQPVSLAEAVRVVVVLLVGAGWLTLDDAAVNTVVSVVGVLVSVGLTWWTGRKVTPLAKPRSSEGVPLVPSSEKTLGKNSPPSPA